MRTNALCKCAASSSPNSVPNHAFLSRTPLPYRLRRAYAHVITAAATVRGSRVRQAHGTGYGYYIARVRRGGHVAVIGKPIIVRRRSCSVFVKVTAPKASVIFVVTFAHVPLTFFWSCVVSPGIGAPLVAFVEVPVREKACPTVIVVEGVSGIVGMGMGPP